MGLTILNRLVFAALCVGLSFMLACQSNAKRYAMTGAVVAVHPETQTVTVHNDDMPGFMAPMDMDYKVRDRQNITSLKSGDKIKGTIIIEGHNPAQLDEVSVVQR